MPREAGYTSRVSEQPMGKLPRKAGYSPRKPACMAMAGARYTSPESNQPSGEVYLAPLLLYAASKLASFLALLL